MALKSSNKDSQSKWLKFVHLNIFVTVQTEQTNGSSNQINFSLTWGFIRALVLVTKQDIQMRKLKLMQNWSRKKFNSDFSFEKSLSNMFHSCITHFQLHQTACYGTWVKWSNDQEDPGIFWNILTLEWRGQSGGKNYLQYYSYIWVMIELHSWEHRPCKN